MGSRADRPGQVRFEAWLPEDLYRRFQETGLNRTRWLRAAVAAELAARSAVVPPHFHVRKAVGSEWVAGQRVTLWECAECGERLG